MLTVPDDVTAVGTVTGIGTPQVLPSDVTVTLMIEAASSE